MRASEINKFINSEIDYKWCTSPWWEWGPFPRNSRLMDYFPSLFSLFHMFEPISNVKEGSKKAGLENQIFSPAASLGILKKAHFWCKSIRTSFFTACLSEPQANMFILPLQIYNRKLFNKLNHIYIFSLHIKRKFPVKNFLQRTAALVLGCGCDFGYFQFLVPALVNFRPPYIFDFLTSVRPRHSGEYTPRFVQMSRYKILLYNLQHFNFNCIN